MQKFIVKKISRSTNITLGISEEQSISQCDDQEPQSTEENLEISSIRMCGYLKKKRNRVGGWCKMYFVLQNSLLMSYNSKEEYEKKLVSFKDVICLIPNNTVLLPSLEPRFTISSNLNTFYTFRCDDNRVCSKWITAILECLSRDLNLEGSGKKIPNIAKNFSSQQNLSSQYQKPICSTTNHSWENLPNNNNWIVNHNGRILLELNYMNCNRAKLPIGAKTAKILQKCSDSNDVINVQTSARKDNFIHDENQNFIHNADHDELRKSEQFRLHHDVEQKQSKEVNQISKMFKSESQRPENGNGSNDYSEVGIGLEEQMKEMTFGDETGDFSSVGNYHSVDSKKFNNKLNIDNTVSEIGEYAEIGGDGNVAFKNHRIEENIIPDKTVNAPYATVNLQKKREERLKKMNTEKLQDQGTVYEDIANVEDISSMQENNIYELIDIPLRPSRKSRSLVWKNWSRIHLFDSLTKRFKEAPEDFSPSPSSETIKKRQKVSLTLSDFSKHLNYRSMRNKARKIYRRNESTLVSLQKKSNENISSCSNDKTTET